MQRERAATRRHTQHLPMQHTQLQSSTQQLPPPTQKFSATQPIPIDLKRSAFLSGNELHHYLRLASLDDTQTNVQAERRAALKAQSQSRYAHWTNTIDAQRRQKKLDRLARLEAEEKKQQELDRQESDYREQQRRAILDRANRLLWQETDKVKQFHGGMLLASVLKEREAQIELKKKKQEMMRTIDQAFHEQSEAERLKAQRMNELEEEKRALNAQHAAALQRQQLREVRERQERERAEQVAEGERIKRVAAEAKREAQEEEAARKQQQWSYNQEYLRANDEQLILKQKRLEREEEELSKIARYATEKERILSERAAAANEIARAKAQRHEAMLSRQYEHLKKIKDEEAARVERQMAEMERKTEERIQADASRALAMREAIHASRQMQLQRKREEAMRNREQEQALAREWKKRNVEMEESEQQELLATKQANLRMAQTQRQQMIAKEERLRAEIEREHLEARMMEEARKREDAVFEAYATMQLQDLQRTGKSAIPLEVVLKNENLKTQRLGMATAMPGNFKFR